MFSFIHSYQIISPNVHELIFILYCIIDIIGLLSRSLHTIFIHKSASRNRGNELWALMGTSWALMGMP